MEFRPIISRKKIFLAFIFILALVPFLQAQVFWQFQWKTVKSGKSLLVDGLLVQLEDRSGFIRLNYLDDEKQTHLVEINLQPEYLLNTKGKLDSNFLAQPLGTSKQLLGNGTSALDNQCLLFKTNTNIDNLMPSHFGVLDGTGRLVNTSSLNSKKQLEENMLLEPLLVKFFLKNEPLYKNYTTAKTRGGFFAGKPIPTMHVIIVADVIDADIGKGCKVDQTKLSQVYISIAQKLRVRLDTIYLVNDTYGKEAIQRTLEDLKPGKDDMVLFHYTGHGFNREDSLDPYPNIFLVPDAQRDSWKKMTDPESQEQGLRVNTLSIQEIYQTIIAKGARLNIVFSDCCNTNYKLKNIPINDLSGTSRGFTNLYPDYCKKLFLDEKVNILATAVKKGEQAASHPTKGSLFTNYYLQIISSYLSPAYNGSIEEVNWNAVIQGTEKKTKETAPSIYNTTTKSPFKMTPFSKIQLKKD